MTSPPQSSESPQEYETPTTLVHNQVQSVDYEEFSLQEKQPHVYQVLEPPPPQTPVYVNKSSQNRESEMYASVAARVQSAKSGNLKTSSSHSPPASPPRDYRYPDGRNKEAVPAQESYNTTTILKVLAVCLIVVMLVVAIAISVTALVLALREQGCECTDAVDDLFFTRINQLDTMVVALQDMIADNLERIEKVEENSGTYNPQLDFVSTLNSSLNRRIGSITEKLSSLDRVVANGVNCTTAIEASCPLPTTATNPRCTTPPVDYRTDQRVIDFSCVSLNEQDPSDIAGTLSATAILNEDTLVCQCTITGLSGDEDQIDSGCGLKVTRCTKISVSFQ